VFLDPPYGKGLAEKALASAREGGWLKQDALIVVEEALDAAFKLTPNYLVGAVSMDPGALLMS